VQPTALSRGENRIGLQAVLVSAPGRQGRAARRLTLSLAAYHD